MRFQRLVAIGLRIVLIMLFTKYLQTCVLLCGAQMNSKRKLHILIIYAERQMLFRLAAFSSKQLQPA